MTKSFLISSEFMGKTAEFAVGCAAVATGMVVAPWAAPALGVAAVLGAVGLSKLIRQKPECEAAVGQIVKTTSRDFTTAHDADEAAVRAAEKALADVLDADGLFSMDRLREAWGRSDRVAEGLAALALDSIAARDPSFAEPGLRRDLANDVLERVFAAAVVVCSAFREMAALTGVETLVGGQREMRELLTGIARTLQDRAGLSDDQVRRVLERFGQTLSDQPIDPSEFEARLLALADQFVKQVVQAEARTNDAPDIAAKRQAAAAALKESEFEQAEALFAEIADAHLETGRRDVLAAASATAEQGGAARLRGDLVDAAGRYGRAAELAAPFDAEFSWVLRFTQADILDDHGRLFPGPSQGEAVRIWRDLCLPHTPRDTRPEDWAGTQNNLGNALKTLGSRSVGEEGVKFLAGAIAAYEAALEVRTRAEAPVDWAATQNNLGVALSALGERSAGAEGVKIWTDAITAYRAALEVYTRADRPMDWAATQNNLGNAYQTLGARSGGAAGVQALADAVLAYEAALEVYTREHAPVDWGMTQNNRGVALKILGERSGGEAGVKALTEAVAAYETALEVYTRADRPADWAATQNNLGNALKTLGSRSESRMRATRLAASVAAYEAALEVYTRSEMPADWASTQNNLGNVYLTLAASSEGEAVAQALFKAVAASEAALEVYTRSEMPALWSMTQNNLGNGYTALGMVLGKAGAGVLAAAVVAYEAALEVRIPTEMPVQWAQTAANLCIVQGVLADVTEDAALACTAADRMIDVIAEFEGLKADGWVAQANRARQTLIETCRRLGGDCAD